MPAAGSDSSKPAKRDDFVIALRGVSFIDRAGAEIQIPWLRIVPHQNHGNVAIWMYDAEGRQCGARHVPPSRVRAVRGMIARSRTRALKCGEFDLTQTSVRSNVWAARGAIIALLAFAGWILAELIVPRALWLWAAWPALSSFDRNIELAMLIGGAFVFLHIPLFALLFVIPAARVNVHRLRVTGEGLIAEQFNGAETIARWLDLVAVRRSGFGFALRLRDGTAVRVHNGLVEFVLLHQAERLGTSLQVPAKRTLIVGFILCQIGAIVIALVAASGLASFPTGAWAVYLMIGWGLPAAISLGGLVPWVFRRAARKVDRKRRVQARERRTGRLV